MLKQVAWIPLPILVALTAILNSTLPEVLPADMVFEPALLFPILTTLFMSCPTLFAAYVAAKAYSKSGMFTLALLGASTFAYGLGALLSSWLLGFGANFLATIGNVRSLFSSIFAFLSVTVAGAGLASERTVKRGGLYVTVLYAAVLSFLVLLTMAAIYGGTPAFFVKGVGYTPMRQTVVEATIMLFAVSSLLMIVAYFKSKASFMYWGSAGFALIAAGSVAIFLQRVSGDPIAWTARIEQYVGCIWLLVGLLSGTGSGAKEER